MSADNRRKLVEMWDVVDNGHHLDAVDGYISDDYVRHSAEGDQTREQFKEMLGDLYRAFPDSRYTMDQIVAEEDRVAYRWVMTGTHQETYMGVPPTQKRIAASGITISRFEDGKIVEDWASWHRVSVLHSLGIIPLSVR
jgi:steroid delta-isomerase-like uncharacterized protein